MQAQRDYSKASKLAKNFYKTQSKVKHVSKKLKNSSKFREKKQEKSNNRKSYERKLEKRDFENFGHMDFLYFFQDTAHKAGIKYVVANLQRDLKMFKMLKKRDYSTREILIMIEFLFLSNQEYLNARNTAPTVLVSGWNNKIYHDSQDWINDEFVPKSKKKHSDREWSEDNTEDSAEIGEWDF